jgi:hypothetical protein
MKAGAKGHRRRCATSKARFFAALRMTAIEIADKWLQNRLWLLCFICSI